MRAMCGAECVVDVKVAQTPELLREAFIVLLFFFVETQILKQ